MALALKGMVQRDKVSSGCSPPPYQESLPHCLSIASCARQLGAGSWLLLINLEKLNGSGCKAANCCVRSSKVRTVLWEGSGLCHCSLAERHNMLSLPVPGDSRHCDEAQEDLDPAQQRAKWVCRQHG